MQIYNFPNMIPVGTVMNATINSKAMQIQNQLFYSIQLTWTGTPTGTFKLQGSCDNSATMTASGRVPYTPTNWTDIASQNLAVSSAGSTMFNESFAPYNFVRVVYTDGSGGTSTAVITVSTMNAKG